MTSSVGRITRCGEAVGSLSSRKSAPAASAPSWPVSWRIVVSGGSRRGGLGQVVEARHGHVLGDPHAAALQLAQCPEGHGIAGAEDGVHPGLQQACGAQLAGAGQVVALRRRGRRQARCARSMARR